MIRQPLGYGSTSTRRVIFPSLHVPEKSDERRKNELTDAEDLRNQTESCSEIPRRSSLPDAPTSSPSTQSSLQLPSKPLTASLGTASEAKGNVTHNTNAKESCLKSSANKTPKIAPVTPYFSPDSLVIPPFKGSCKESAPVIQVPQEVDLRGEGAALSEEEQDGQIFAASTPHHRHPSPKPLKSLLRTKSGPSSLLRTKSSPSSVPGLTSIQEDDEEGSESSEDTCSVESESPKLGRSKSLKEDKSITFDPRVWVFEFERSGEEFDTTWFSQKEMERFKKQALIRVYVHALRQEELIPTGTGRIIKKPIQIPTKAIFTSPALAMDGEPDEDMQLESEMDTYRKNLSKEENRDASVIDAAR